MSRRVALSGAAGAGLALPLLAACGDDAPATGQPSGVTATPSPTESAAAPAPSAPAVTSPSEPADDTGVLVATADVPVGGGIILTDDRVVVTQPTAGEFRCFSAVCTHSGCLVSGVGASITCECHLSSFDLTTGEVLGGPAPAPLPAVDVTIEKDQVLLT